jgi:4-diphosphocytidyl-2-C-methyl-D-erythritol kinase
MPLQRNDTVRLRAYAKINLSLQVFPLQPDGYHGIDSVMQSVSLHDEVEVKPSGSGIKVKCSPNIDENIAGKAAKMLLDEIKSSMGVDITVKKHIPLAAGLAGGSADAAAVLIGMNLALGINLHKFKLMEIGAKVGSDVPFCLNGGTCRVTGRGEKVERINPQSGGAFILVFPKVLKSTKAVYAEFDKVGAGKSSGNDLEAAAMSIEPELKKIKDDLIKLTGGNWRMSGAGPALFLELSDISEAERYVDKIKDMKLEHQLVMRMDNGVELVGG